MPLSLFIAVKCTQIRTKCEMSLEVCMSISGETITQSDFSISNAYIHKLADRLFCQLSLTNIVTRRSK